MSQVKIIGTGLTGLVGSRIVELLSNYDFVDFSLDNEIDITDFAVLKQAFSENKDAKIVLHLAAFTNVDKAWEQKNKKELSCYQVNVLGTKNIAKLCKKHNKYLIHISTDFIFDGINPPKRGYTEKDIPNPIEWYGETKYLAEKEVSKSECDYSIVRIAFPYKLKPSLKESSIKQDGKELYKLDLVRKMIQKLKNNEILNLFNDQFICPTFIDDIAYALGKIIEKKPENEIFHCVGGKAITPYELGVLIAKILSLSSDKIKGVSLSEYLNNNPKVRPYQPKLVLSSQKLYNYLGVKTIGIDEGVKEYAN